MRWLKRKLRRLKYRASDECWMNTRRVQSDRNNRPSAFARVDCCNWLDLDPLPVAGGRDCSALAFSAALVSRLRESLSSLVRRSAVDDDLPHRDLLASAIFRQYSILSVECNSE